jgi:hypothetical protein
MVLSFGNAATVVFCMKAKKHQKHVRHVYIHNLTLRLKKLTIKKYLILSSPVSGELPPAGGWMGLN